MSSRAIIDLGPFFNFDPARGAGALGDAMRVWKLLKDYEPFVDPFKGQSLEQGVWSDGRKMVVDAFESYINQQLGKLFMQFGQEYASRVDTTVDQAMPDMPRDTKSGQFVRTYK